MQWLPLTWDAVATLLTGLAAVVGAILIGLRQSKITEVQAEIQRDQLNQERAFRSNEFRLHLLDRRSKCISDIKAVSQAFHEKVELSDQEFRSLYLAIQEAELIFHPDVIAGLTATATKTLRLPVARRAHQSAHVRGDEKDSAKWLDRASSLEKEVFEALPKLIESMISTTRIGASENE